MRISKFKIENYRAIQEPILIDVERDPLTAIIGVNESGKTTILHGVFAFDPHNDRLNAGEHLVDIRNLRDTKEHPALISAEIALTPDEFIKSVDEVVKTEGINPELHEGLIDVSNRYRDSYRDMPNFLWVTRNLQEDEFSLSNYEPFDDPIMNDLVARKLINNLPYILYFDDFRDAVPDEIEITKDKNGTLSDWLGTIEEVFRRVDPELTVFDLPSDDPRIRDTKLARVSDHLNDTLSKEWQHYKLDDIGALSIDLAYDALPVEGGGTRHVLKFRIIDKDATGAKQFFHIRNRSKGFFWFFNFVMKLEFNPKASFESDENTVFLLDEPGSNLHGSPQTKLAKKLKSLSESSAVIYCTHSHNLLDPDSIPLKSVNIAEKDGLGRVSLIPIYKHRSTTAEQRMAFQPVIDALQIKPFLLDMSLKRILLTEGIVDYYAFEMFKPSVEIGALPSVNADSIRYYISLMIAWSVDFRALWDNDPEGQKHLQKATDVFGEEIATGRFFLLPLKTSSQKKRILQNLFNSEALNLIRSELGLAKNQAFDQTIRALYYSPNRTAILDKISDKTKDNFKQVFAELGMT